MLEYVGRYGFKYFVLGLISGPVMGALGGWWRQHPNALVPLLVAVLAFGKRWAWQWHLGFDPGSVIFTGEAVPGVAVAIAMLVWVRRAPGASPTASS